MTEDRELRALIADLEARVAALEQNRSRPFSPITGTATAPRAVETRADGDAGLGLKIVNRVGAITLAVGIIFFFKYAAENQWIGPAARVLLGIVLSAVLLVSSEWFVRRGQRIFAQGLAGCGIGTLYISLYAAFGFYRLIGDGVAFTLLVLLSLGVIALSLQRRNAIVALLGLFAALLTPQLVELARPATWATVQAVYLLLLQITALAVALRLQSAVLVPATAAMVVLTALVRIHPVSHATFGWLMLALAAVHFAAWSVRKLATVGQNSGSVLVCAHCFLALSCLRGITSLAAHNSMVSAAGSIFLAAYGVVLLAMGLSNSSTLDRTLGLLFLGLVVLKLYLFDIWTLAFGTRITAFVALGLLLLLASFLYGRVRSKA